MRVLNSYFEGRHMIKIELDDPTSRVIISKIKNYGYKSEEIISQVSCDLKDGFEFGLQRLEESTKIKAKNWATFPDWILI